MGCDGTRPNATCGWIMADQIYLMRTKLTAATANSAAAYEYFKGNGNGGSVRESSDNGGDVGDGDGDGSGGDDGGGGRGRRGVPIWTSNLEEATPLIDWPGRAGVVNCVWVPALGRYAHRCSSLCSFMGGSVAIVVPTWTLHTFATLSLQPVP